MSTRNRTLGESENGVNGYEPVSTTDVRTHWPVDEVVMLDNILLFSQNKCFAKGRKSLKGAFWHLPCPLWAAASESKNHSCAQ